MGAVRDAGRGLLDDVYRLRGWEKYKVRETSEAIVGAIPSRSGGRWGDHWSDGSGAPRSSVDRVVVFRRMD